MDDFMEKLLKEVSQDTNNIGNMGNGQNGYMPKQPAAGYTADNMLNNDQQPVNNFRQPMGNMTVNPLQSTQPLPNMQQYGMPQQNMQGMPQPIHVQQMQQPQQPQQMQQQIPPQMQQTQQQSFRQPINPAPGEGYGQRQGNGAVAFEDVSYFPDAGDRTYTRPLPGAEELAMEARKSEAYEERFRNNTTSAAAQGNGGQALPFDQEKFMEDIHNIVHIEVVKCYKNTEAAIGESAEKVTESYGKITSPKPFFGWIIFLLAVNLILELILVLHIFFRII